MTQAFLEYFWMFLWFLPVGIAAGLMAGLLGIGGGLIIVPSLLLIFNLLSIVDMIVVHLSIGTSLATIMFTSLGAIRVHHKRGVIDWNIVLWLVCGICVGAFVGTWSASQLTSRWLAFTFGCFALFMAVQMAFRFWLPRCWQLPGPKGLIVAGSVLGFFSTLLGVGGGTLAVPFLLCCQRTMHAAVGIAAACGFPIAVLGMLGYTYMGWNQEVLPEGSLGYVYWPAVFSIVIVSVISAHWGAHWAHTISASWLKRIFSVILAAVGLRLLWF